MRIRILGSPFLGTDTLWVWEELSGIAPVGAEVEAVVTRHRGAEYLRRRRITQITAMARRVPPEEQLVPLETPAPWTLDPTKDLVEQGVLDGDTLLVICIDREEASAAVWRAEALVSNRFPSAPPLTITPCSGPTVPVLVSAPPPLPSALRQAELRIFIARAQGSGHQGCSVQLMRSLRRLGFRGRFDVVYDDAIIEEDKGRRIGQKLVDLLPGYKFNPKDDDVQTFDAFGLSVRVTSLTHFQTTGTRRAFALTGALDREREHEHILDKLEVDYFVQLQPMDWTSDSGHRRITYRDDGVVKVHDLSKLYPLGYLYDDPTLSSPKTTIPQLLAEAEQSGKADALLAFDDACGRPLDCHTQIGYGFSTSMSEGDVPCSLFNLVMGALRLQDGDPRHRGIVIGISGWSEKAELALLDDVLAAREDALRTLLDGHRRTLDDLSPLLAHLRTRLFDADERRRARAIDVLHEDAAKLIASTPPSTVLLVALGRVPEPVFNHLVKRTSLPNCFESVNGMDRERQNKPYIHVAKDISNKFPRSDFVDGSANAASDRVAEGCERLGRLFQGSASLGLWVRNYCSTSPVSVFRTLRELPPKEQEALGLKTVAGKAIRHVLAVYDDPPSLILRIGTAKETVSTRDKLAKLLTHNSATLGPFRERLRRDDPDRLIGGFMAATLDPSSPESTYFAKLKAISLGRDQVRLALEDLQELPGASTAASEDPGPPLEPPVPSSAKAVAKPPPEPPPKPPQDVEPHAVVVPRAPAQIRKTLTLVSLTWEMGTIPTRMTLSFNSPDPPLAEDLVLERKNEALALAVTRVITTPVDVLLSGETGPSSYRGLPTGLRFYDDGDYTVSLSVASGYVRLAYRISPA